MWSTVLGTKQNINVTSQLALPLERLYAWPSETVRMRWTSRALVTDHKRHERNKTYRVIPKVLTCKAKWVVQSFLRLRKKRDEDRTTKPCCKPSYSIYRQAGLLQAPGLRLRWGLEDLLWKSYVYRRHWKLEACMAPAPSRKHGRSRGLAWDSHYLETVCDTL